METLGKEFPSYSTVKNGQQSLRGGERALTMIDGLAALKMPPLKKVVQTMVIRDRRRNLQIITREVAISFGAVKSILTDI